ncbi:MAG: hypothetical protein NZM25_05750 [Leptospiraceae bacterium]|nr:hypothetical protein [Leptospiraceae bacterium]
MAYYKLGLSSRVFLSAGDEQTWPLPPPSQQKYPHIERRKSHRHSACLALSLPIACAELGDKSMAQGFGLAYSKGRDRRAGTRTWASRDNFLPRHGFSEDDLHVSLTSPFILTSKLLTLKIRVGFCVVI